MKHKYKDYLKRMKTYGFKWDKDPLEIFKECQDEVGTIEVSKSDLKKMLRYAMLRDYNNTEIIRKMDFL